MAEPLPNRYWLTDEGPYRAEPPGVVAEDDAAYRAFLNEGGIPSRAPDEEGRFTVEAVEAVLRSYGALPGEIEPQPMVTYKADLYRRCTNEEANAMEMALAAAPVRDRRLFESVQTLRSDDPDFARMREVMVGMFGESRVGELLAPSV